MVHMEMAHGTTKTYTPHIGLCLTDDETAAADYAIYDGDDGDPVIHFVDIDLGGLTVTEINGYDPTSNVAPGDQDGRFEADVIVFTDETIRGRGHRTWRLMTPAAVAAAEYICTEEADA